MSDKTRCGKKNAPRQQHLLRMGMRKVNATQERERKTVRRRSRREIASIIGKRFVS